MNTKNIDTNKNNKCPECNGNINDTFKYCPFCRVNLIEVNVSDDLLGVETILSDTEPLSSSNVSFIFKVFQKMGPKNPKECHVLEEKMIYKFIRCISECEYTLKDMIVIAKKISAFNRLSYTREY